jgi:PAS domain S-box-containing protein
MSEGLRKTGIEAVGDVPWGTHFCQFYQTGQDLLDILVPYFSEGLRNNEFCLWVTSEPLGVEAARRAMTAALPDFESYVRRGQIEIIAHTDWYLKGGAFDSVRVLNDWVSKLDQALAAGYAGLRLTGNTFWLEQKDWRAFTDYEAAVDGVIGRYRMLAVCTYSLDRCGFNEILDVIRNHRFALVRREGRWELVENAERQRTQDELQRSREWLRVTLTSIGDAVLATDNDCRITFLNPVASSLTGWSVEEALGRPIEEVFRIVNELTREPVKDLCARVLAEGRAIALANNSSLIAKDGREVPIEDSAAPILDNAGGVAGAVLVFHDVTAKREAQRALRASEEKYRLLFKNMAEGFALYELIDDEAGRPVDYRVLEVNDAYTRHTGILREQIVGRRVGEVFPVAVEDYLPIFARVVDTQAAESFETFARAVGRHQRVYTFPAGGRRFASTIEDISARRSAEEALRESEERFRSLFSSMTEGFALHEIMTDERGEAIDYRFLDLNPAFERLTGLKRDEVVGRPVTEVLPGIEPFWIERYGRVALAGEPVTFERYFPAPLNLWYQVYSYRPAPRQFAVIFTDVTDRKRVEEELRQRHAEIQALFDNTPAGLVLFDGARPYTVLVHNKYYQELFAEPFRTRGMVGLNVFEYAPEVEAEGVVAVFDEVVRTRQPKNFLDFPYKSNPPKQSWFNWHMSPIILDDQVIALVSMSVDVTDRHLAEQALRDSEERLRRAQEIAHLGSWELDLVSNRLTWSDEVYRVFGLTPDGFGANYEAFLDAVHPDDRAAVDAAYSASLAEGRDSYEIEHRIVRRDTGEIRVVHEKCEHKRDASGRIVRSIGMVHDITESKKAEVLRQALAEQERLRLGAAVEQASDSVAMVDLDGTIQYVNAAFESINKITRDKAMGGSYFDFVAGKSQSLAAIREAIAQGRPWHGHLSGSIAGGRPVELEVTISPAMDPMGKVIGGLITEKDVTQENALQRQVRQSQKMEALGTLAGGITHDFNNILSTIFINTELAMLDLDPTNPARRSLPIVLQAANRGKELVKQIITFSRQREWERKPLEVAPIVKEGLKFLRSTLSKDIEIHESIAVDCGPILADPSQVHQILVNLCQNAALAMADQTGHLEVKLEPIQVDATLAARHPDLKPGPYARLTVADNGCGMTSDVIERIFEPFFTTRNHGEGSGLGLAVVHGIVKSYDGAITVYSEPGKGSVFNVYIPRLAGGASAGEKDKRVRPEKGKEHILLVEDEEAQLTGMTRLLGRLGYRVTAKPTGRTALTAFKKKPEGFDLVITDQAMPRMTGVELARALVKVRPDIPIILCTGFSEKVNGETVGHDGIRSLVMKPFSIQEISKYIRAALDKKNSQV